MAGYMVNVDVIHPGHLRLVRRCFALAREPRSMLTSSTGLLCVLGQVSLLLWASVLSERCSQPTTSEGGWKGNA